MSISLYSTVYRYIHIAALYIGIFNWDTVKYLAVRVSLLN